jgi:hypothetical protein
MSKEATAAPPATRGDNEGLDIFNIANHRRFSIRKRKNVDNLTYADTLPRTKKNNNNSSSTAARSSEQRSKEEIIFPLQIGTEIFIAGKIKENQSFTGEVLVVQDYNSGTYKLEMANTCSGLWGNYIFRSEESLRNISLIQTPAVPLIPIEFSLLNAVYDNRAAALAEKYPVDKALKGWRWVDSWAKLTWTTQPLQLSYQHIFNLARAAISDDYAPVDGTSLFVSLTPLSVSSISLSLPF